MLSVVITVTAALLIWLFKPAIKIGWSRLMRWMLNRRSQWAQRRLKALRGRLDGFVKQVTAGEPREDARAFVMLRLEWLDIWPQGIRGEGAGNMVGAEAEYLLRCTDSDYGLELARTRFPRDGTQEWMPYGDGVGAFMGDEYRRSQLEWHYGQMKKRP